MKTILKPPVLLTGAALALFLLGAGVSAQAPAPRLSLQYLPAAVSADSLILKVAVALPPGWHLNSATPLDSFLVPTRLEASGTGLAFGKPRFPEPVLEYSQVMGGNVSLYTGDFEVSVPVRKQSRNPKTYSLASTQVTLRYQACNNSMCLPPKTVTATMGE